MNILYIILGILKMATVFIVLFCTFAGFIYYFKVRDARKSKKKFGLFQAFKYFIIGRFNNRISNSDCFFQSGRSYLEPL